MRFLGLARPLCENAGQSGLEIPVRESKTKLFEARRYDPLTG